MLERFGLSIRKACKILGINRTTYLYESKEKNDTEILERMKQILVKHPRAESNTITMYLHKDDVQINHKCVERLYSENKMQLKNRKKRHKKYTVKKREEHILTETPGNWIAIDFVIDSIANTDNGSEFRSSAVQSWCKNHAVTQVFLRPRKPTDNCFIESFDRTFRDECLNENYFTSLSEAKEIIENWRIDSNENRPQKGLKELTPSEFKLKIKGMKTLLKFGQI